MKKRINLNFLFILLIQTQQNLSSNTKKLRSDINCSQYENDNYIIDSFPFPIPVNPSSENSQITYGKMNANYSIYFLRIVNQKEVPLLVYCFKYLSNLEIVNTSFSDFEQGLPIEIEYLACSLIELQIYNTKITHLPEEIGQLKYLKVLILSNTGLLYLPYAIGDLTELNVLSLSENNLRILPKTMKNLRKLKRITLTNNFYLDSLKSLDGLPSLEILDARKCSITNLPQNLPRLTDLYMSNNNLKKLTGIQTLGSETDNSKVFYFDQNHIRTLTSQIRSVSNLDRLSLRQNNLHTLPEDIYTISTLSYLNIQQNSFNSQDLKKILAKFHEKIPNATILHD